MLSYEVNNLKNELKEKVEKLKSDLNQFKNIEFENYQKSSDTITYRKMLAWLCKTDEELDKIIYNDDFSML